MNRLVAAVLVLACGAVQAQCPLVIAHRGASGERPEHTLESYRLAIEQGADFIEPDLVMTKDGHFIARHENVLAAQGGEATTNVAAVAAFKDRLATKTIYGHEVTGWFAEDFTLAELKTLRARERMPEVRPQSASFDDQFQLVTFAEVAALARSAGVGVYPELKQPSYFAALGMDVAARFAAEVERGTVALDDQLLVQSFEAAPLRQLRERFGAQIRLVQLSRQWPDLGEVATYANGVGLPISIALRPGFVISAHAYGLFVHPYTLRAESAFLPDDQGFEDVLGGLRKARVDGVFTDHPGMARAVLGCAR